MFNPQPKPEKRKKESKVKIWLNVMHEEIIPQFEKWGIRTCEIGLEDCVKTIYLGFAHTKKRRNIETPEDLRRVVLACQSCHHKVEYHCKEITGKSMGEFLEDIIQKRETRLKKRVFTI